jgi:hypothetical protein
MRNFREMIPRNAVTLGDLFDRRQSIRCSKQHEDSQAKVSMQIKLHGNAYLTYRFPEQRLSDFQAD